MSDDYKGGFEELTVWEEARNYRKAISAIVKKFPGEEKFKLVSQLVRSARSVHANIAEGYGRFHYQENIQFCRQARGTLMETLDHLINVNDDASIDDVTLQKFREHYMLILKLLNGYIGFLKRKKIESLNPNNNLIPK